MIDPRDLDDLIAVWRAGSLSGAAKRRGVAISTISRRIDALEVALKLRLIDKQARGSMLTRQGLEIAAAAEPLSVQIDRVVRVADALRGEATNLPVRLSATEFVISDVLAPALPKLGGNFPLHLRSQGDIISLAGRDADLAIRMSRPEGASLIAKKLPLLRLGWFASRDFLAGRDPATLDLGEQPLLVYDDSYGRLPELDWLDRHGLRGSVRMQTGSTRALTTAAISGAGVAILAVAMARRAPELVEIVVPEPLPSRTPWLLVHRDLRRQPAIAKVHKWVIETFDQVVREAPIP